MIGTRVRERLASLKMSQSELARRVGLTQGTIAGLISGRSRSSTYLHKIARELLTTPAYLSGEIDDPDLDAPPAPPPAPPRVMLEVILPSEEALAEMFEALLDGIDPAAPTGERALLLAQRLPIGLSQLRDLKRGPTPGRERSRATAREGEDLAMPLPARQS